MSPSTFPEFSVGLPRSSYYYKAASESELNLTLMRWLDEQYMATPFYGYRKMTHLLRKAGHQVSEKRVARLMRLMGIQAIYPQPKTSVAAVGHKVYPYLL